MSPWFRPSQYRSERLRESDREQEVEQELRNHLDLETEALEASGMSKKEAHLAALRQLGNVRATKEDVLQVWKWVWLEQLVQDLNYAIRTLRRTPVLTSVIIATFALGIGATTATFGQINALFWKKLPVQDPEQLRIFSWTSPEQSDARESSGLPSFSDYAYENLRDRTSTFSDVACWVRVSEHVGETGRFNVTAVSDNYFRALGANAFLGRVVGGEDDRSADPERVAVLSYRMWERAFNRDPDVLERTIEIKGILFEIIGVMPRGFVGLDPVPPVDVVIPHATASLVSPFPDGFTDPDSWRACRIFGRIQIGISDARAEQEANLVLSQTILSEPPNEQREGATLSLTDARQINTLVRQRARTSLPLLTLLLTVSAMLIVACANIAGLLLARNEARQKEMATRLTVGAPPVRIVRQLLTESLLLSAIGGLLGIGIAFFLAPILPSLMTRISAPIFVNGQAPAIGISMNPDISVLAFAVAVSAFTGIACGLLPTLRTTRFNLVSMMKQSSEVNENGRFAFRTQKALVAFQVALSMLLLIGAGLFIRTVLNISAIPLGYDPDRLLFVGVLQPTDPVGGTLNRLENLPGVDSASASTFPLYNNASPKAMVCIPTYGPTPQPADLEPVQPRFFETWGVPLLEGEDFRNGDEPTAIVNEAFARDFFFGSDPLGATIGIDGCPGAQRTIIAVVGDHGESRRRSRVPMVYVHPEKLESSMVTFAVRTTGDPETVVPGLRRIFSESNVFGNVTTGRAYREGMNDSVPSLTSLLVFFGCLALLISCLGLYGMLAYIVSRRTPEIGIRIALGAQRFEVLRMVVRESLMPVVIGIVIGVVAAMPIARRLDGVFFGVSSNDPWTISVAVIAFLGTASVAVALPVRRACRINPLTALRSEH